MKYIPVRFEDIENTILELGFVGENLYRGVVFDCTSVFAEYPTALPGLTVTPPVGDSYPGVVTRDGNNVIWNLTNADMAVKGNGEIQLSLFVDPMVGKSATGRTLIRKSLAATGEAPDPVEDWLERAEETLADLPQTVYNAIEEAAASGQFKGDPGFSPVVITESITGGTSVTITDEEGPHNFNVMDGQQGATPEFGIGTVATLEPGQSATASITGTADHPVLNLGIPRGQDADPTSIAKAYNELTFPVVANTLCMYDGDLYYANQAIQTAEEWNEDHWTQTSIEELLSEKADKTDTVLNTTLSRGRKASTTVGTGSFAFGYDATASGDYSHAEGRDTWADGNNSHAEGVGGTWTEGSGSGAFDITAIAYGTAAHVEGYQSRTLEDSGEQMPYLGSHAEGYRTAAWKAGHSEGVFTQATGPASHAEGYSSTASGNDAHAEGYNTIASGVISHAEGNSTRASGMNAHAEGAGGTYTDPFTSTSYYSDAAGYCSHTEGSNCRVEESKAYAHAEGFATYAADTAAHSEGAQTKAASYGAHSEGVMTLASGYASHAEGNYAKASGNSAHSEGQYTNAPGDGSHAEGIGSSATQSNYGAKGKADHAEGYQTTANSGSISSYYGAHAEGYQTIASNLAAHAEGQYTTASGTKSHAEGYNTVASAANSHAEGHTTKAAGGQSHAEGHRTEANEVAAHAEGYQTQANGVGSHAQGYLTVASRQYQFVHGIANIPEDTEYVTVSLADAPEWQPHTARRVGDYVKVTDGNNVTLRAVILDVPAEFNPVTDANGTYWVVLNDVTPEEMAEYPFWSADGTYSEEDRVKMYGYDGILYAFEAQYDNPPNDVDVTNNIYYTTVQDGARRTRSIRYAEIVGNGTGTGPYARNAYALERAGNGRFAGDVYVGCDPDSNGGTKLAKVSELPTFASDVDFATLISSYPVVFS